ncbi:MAG: IS110 family transposase [Chlorobi bacterium]|nr:IS110 family transposase [Chlorobiota bacterium]
MRLRAEAYAHIQTIFRQHCMNIASKDVKNKLNRRKLINRISDPFVQKSIEMNLDLIDFFDPKLNKIEREIRAEAKNYDRTTHNLLITVPGIGDMMSLVILFEIGDINRFPSPQKFSSYCRLVKCERESGGRRYRGGNQKIRNPYLKWAIGDIVVHAPRTSPVIKQYYDRLTNK